MIKDNYLRIITDEVLMEKRNHGQIAFPFQYYLEDVWDFDFHTLDWHWHQEIEFIYVRSGEAHCHIGNESFILSEGCGIFINTKIIHQLTAEQSTLIPNIVFSSSLFAPMESFLYQQYIKPILTSDISYLIFEPNTLWHKEILTLLNQIFEVQKQTNFRELTTMRLLITMWEVLYRNTEPLLLQKHASQSTSNVTRLQMMMSFIHSHYTESIQLDDIADFVHISKNNCMQIFKDGIQQSPVSYLIRYRLKIAAQLLSSTEMKIIAITEESGFHDASYFCRKFKELYGISPAEYRKSCR